jgi:hypothetical protein
VNDDGLNYDGWFERLLQEPDGRVDHTHFKVDAAEIDGALQMLTVTATGGSGWSMDD